ncbi:DUF4418 family protein [Treponema sp. R6D11]
MKSIDLKTGNISLKNLMTRPVRTACLFVVVAILAFTLFGGSILALNLRQGLDTMTKRFGADLMVVPKGSGEKAQALLLRGDSGYFYFGADIVDKVAGTEGVACASPQFFLTSLSADCCDEAVQLIAYDPDTDFVVQPWIAEKHHGSISDGQVIVGTHIGVHPIGVGAVIAALGIALIVFTCSKIQLGLTIGVFLSSVNALLVIYALIGGCAHHTMPCREIAFPAITVISIILIIKSGIYAVYLARKK